MSTIFSQQTGVVKTLPQHNPINLILRFFLQIPMNSQFDLFILTNFFFSSNKDIRLTTFFTLQFKLNNTLFLLL